MIELSNISRKAMLQQTFSRCVIETGNLFAITLRVLLEKTVGQQHDVLSSASSNRPARSVFASVKAPLTCPNSSLSNKVSDRPPIFTVIMVRNARGERA